MGKAKQGKGNADGGESRARGRKPRRGIIHTLVVYGLAVAVWFSVIGGLILAYVASDLPAIDEAVLHRRPNITILDTTGAEIATVGDIFRGPVRAEELPAYVSGAFIAVEDRRFYSHFGVDPLGLVRAVVTAATDRLQGGSGRIRGTSTITQQVAKNLFLTPERAMSRKVREALLAVKLEQQYTKSEILSIYLNRVDFGAGTYGIEAAADRYFGRSAKELSVYQAAVLAGLLRAPSRYNPTRNPERAADRAATALSVMAETGVISAETAKAAQADGLRALKVVKAERGNMHGRHFVDWVLSQIDDFAGPTNSDLVITTTLDLKLQREMEEVLARHLAQSGEKLKVSQGAIVLLSPDGAVRAMVGGRDWMDSQFNRATQALRQPGSAFKPVVFLAALEHGMKPDDEVLDAPITIGKWTPRNYTGRYEGPVTVETALAESLNTATVRIANQVGVKAVIATARRLGISHDMKPNLSLALGSNEVTLLELAGAYAPFANGGEAVMPFGIATIGDREGATLYVREPGTLGQVVGTDEVAIMNRMMNQVLVRGTGTAAAFGYPAAGKSGTSSDYRDAWFMGFTADYIGGVWIGNDDGAEMNKVSGGGLPAHIWRDAMKAAHVDHAPRDLPGLAPLVAVTEPGAVTSEGVGGLIERVIGN